MNDACWTLAAEVDSSSDQQTSVVDLKLALEKGTDDTKIETMKQIISIMVNGDSLASLMMHVIRFVLPSKNKTLKKLLLFYWEICSKKNSDGKLKQEMILVWCVSAFISLTLFSNYLRNDLQSPNEFIRGATLRFLSKLREPELLEPLLPSCRLCLVCVTHRSR